MTEILSKYTKAFKTLNRGFSKGLGKAPHKPILLLSVMQQIEKGSINSNRIFITPDLLLSFNNNWKMLVETKHISNFSLPFFHMRSESFWILVTAPSMKLKLTKSKSIKSFKNLRETIAFAEIDKYLFKLLQDPINRAFFTETLLRDYFPNTKANFNQINTEELKIENQILNEEKLEYQTTLSVLRASLDNDKFEQELFIRGGLFKKTIPKIYNDSCCISGMKIESSTNAQMIDACHIVPFSISNDDTIPNGISLSPNLHRAFDRGLLTINKEYIVEISPFVKENNSTFSLSQFNGKKIMLPEKASWYPSREYLTWHNKERFII
ncbi:MULTISPECIES: HNH endonuclease [unclassified Polaribacter]|uniref:HNH endonuclease n=1 Tax=unclassified Polaribacter TaxID=196858 RepID=UPI0011BD64EB|nr:MULTISPECIES: HNH endonuclease [unclassified Polaribacter]TXD53583.1 HNH endonuclease [Polaribacter sp. IC063]TXD62176.1 HNH endonuclease [Polaribacter sp. IC066]